MNWSDTVNCTSTSSSQSSTSSLAYRLPVTVQRTVPPGYLQKKRMDTWYLSWQMARNDSSIFLNSNGVSVMKITWYSASTHTTVSPTAASRNVLAFIRESLLVLRDHFDWHWNFSQTKNFRWVQNFVGANHPRKLDLLKIYSTKYFSHKNFRVYGNTCAYIASHCEKYYRTQSELTSPIHRRRKQYRSGDAKCGVLCTQLEIFV